MPSFFETFLARSGSTIPLIIDEDHLLDIIREFSGIHLTSIDECKTGNIPGISLFEKAEETKHLSVKDIRNWIEEISSIPYEEKHIYILKDFDEATHSAQNASLKILEEPPSYAKILLLVHHSESLLETVRSRCIDVSHQKRNISENSKIALAVSHYYEGSPEELISYIYKGKFEKPEALEILFELTKHGSKEELDYIEDAIIHIFSTNENPRNILDTVILRISKK